MKYLVNTTCYCCYYRARGSLQHPSINLSWGNRINFDYIIGTGDLSHSLMLWNIYNRAPDPVWGGRTRWGATGPIPEQLLQSSLSVSLSSSGSPTCTVFPIGFPRSTYRSISGLAGARRRAWPTPTCGHSPRARLRWMVSWDMLCRRFM